MKNFTNNFKQFTSRLSARWLIMALMLLLGTSSAWGGVQFTNDYIFLDLSSSVSEWEKDGAVFQVALNEWDHCGNGWNGANETGHLSKKYDLIETSEGSHIYYANVSDDNKSRYGAYFYRCNPSDKSVWNTACIGYNNSSHNCFKVNEWTSSTSTYNLTDVYCISAPTFGEVEVGQSATSSGTYLYAGVSTIPEISNNSTEFQYVAGSSSITTNGLSTITVKFTPSSAGDKTGTLKFGSYLTTSLSGKGKVSTKIPSGTKLYFDFSNATTWGSGHFLSIVAPDNTSYTAGYGNTSGVGNGKYSPKKDQTWVSLTEECTNIYSYTTTTDITTGISLWANNINTYNDVYQTDVVLNLKASDFDSQKLCFTVGSNSTNHGTQKTDCFGGSWGSTIPVCCISPDFSVQLSNATVTKGDENITASTTGTHSPAVAWTSSDETVATIDADGNITAIKEGQTNITATTTGDDGFCEGVEKTATLTVKSPITTVALEHANSDGTLKAETPTYCVGDVVYFKLTHDGSPFSEYDWTTYPGSGLAGYCSNGSGLYHFTLSGSGTIGISLRNEENVDGEGNPTWVESNLLEFNTRPEPTAPYISINPASGVLCEGNTATITVTNPSTDCAYKLVDESPEAEFVEYESGDLKYSVGSVGKYYVAAKHKLCPTNEYTSNQVEINQIISTSASISIEPANPETTPWEPVTITVNPQEGYVYELSYTGNNLAGVDGVIIKQNGDSYTYYIPRPWGTGDATPVRTAVEYGIKAQLKVDGEASQCDLNYATATIQLKDEDNEDCNQ